MSQMLRAIFVVYSTSGVTSVKKNSSRPLNGGHFENVKMLNTASMWHQKWKDHSKLYKKKYFHSDDVIDDIIKWPQSRFSIFLYEWKNDIFRDNWRTNKDIIFKLSVLMYHWIGNTPLQTIVDCFIDDVIRFQNRSKIWTAIALSVFELEHRSKAQNVTNAHSYLCSIFKFQFHFRQKISSRPQNGGHFENVKISNTASIWH